MLFPSLQKNVFSQDKVVKIGLLSSLFFVLLSFLAFYFLLPPQVEPVALRYSIYFGIDLIGQWWSIFLFPLAGLAITAINFYLAYKLSSRSHTLVGFLVVGSIAFQIFLIIITLLILLLNK
ncbi:hypothetical protein GYA54_01045 [Candidatus Kuenenbacteria bacterium]|nr:hypothetical protein [Candidatus Kuenenbacteria bacterium]